MVTHMRLLRLDPPDVEFIVLSHGHSDHGTGLIHQEASNRPRMVIPGRELPA
jgi:metal-dependent hydrolase (beta-lactamase superfamily II)